MTRKRKFFGYVGILNGTPFFEGISDGYCNGIKYIERCEIFRNKKEAEKIFHEVRGVTFELHPLTRKEAGR